MTQEPEKCVKWGAIQEVLDAYRGTILWDAVAVLEALAVPLPSTWRDAAEKPEKDGKYLACYIDEYGNQKAETMMYFKDTRFRWLTLTTNKVTHWMPIPPLPEKGEKE